MTIYSKDYVIELIKKNGVDKAFNFNYSSIWQYNSINGVTMYAIFIKEAHNDIFTSPYVRDPIVRLWDRNNGITDEGIDLIRKEGGD